MKKVFYILIFLLFNFNLCFGQVELIPFINHNKFYKSALDYHFSEIIDYTYYKNYFAKRCVKTIQMVSQKENRTDTTSKYIAVFSENSISVIAYDEGSTYPEIRNYFFDSGKLSQIKILFSGNIYCKYNNRNNIESITEVSETNDTTFIGKYFYKNKNRLIKSINISKNYRGNIKYDTTIKSYVYRLCKRVVKIYEDDSLITKFRLRKDSTIKKTENNEDGYEFRKYYYLKNTVFNEITYNPNKEQVQDKNFDIYYYQDGNLKYRSWLSTDNNSTQNIINYDYNHNFLISKKARLFDDYGLETYYSKYNYTFYDCSCVTDSTFLNKKYLVVSLFYNETNISGLTGTVIKGSIFDTAACFRLQVDTLTCINDFINLNKGCLIFDLDTFKAPLDLSLKELTIVPVTSTGSDFESTLKNTDCINNNTINYWLKSTKNKKNYFTQLNIEFIKIQDKNSGTTFNFPSLSFIFKH
ncbi:MAG TPA: hypothetical protein PKK00_01870 [Bacteroidales bacterium]|nr:hypothetical protein [Bacteroidales bacterium]HPS16202.1 hypothetical protein [Bacteroidales bacterium]